MQLVEHLELVRDMNKSLVLEWYHKWNFVNSGPDRHLGMSHGYGIRKCIHGSSVNGCAAVWMRVYPVV